MSDISEMQLLHLSHVAKTSRYGLVDRGFPQAYARLATMGYLEKKHNGYVITTLGLETLKLNKERLYGKNRKALKKEKKAIYEDDD